jgi:hypothetical protein
MKREPSPGLLAFFLILGGTLFSVVSSRYPVSIPDFSPLMAIAYIGAMYLPRRWGWLVGPAVFLITNVVYLERNYRSNGAMLSWDMLPMLGVYLAAGGLGILISFHKSLPKIILGSLACSVLFYVVSNTFAWLMPVNGYEQTFAGWWQANTVGVPAYSATSPTWIFLRNQIAGDLFFGMLLLLALDRSLLLGRASVAAETRTA